MCLSSWQKPRGWTAWTEVMTRDQYSSDSRIKDHAQIWRYTRGRNKTCTFILVEGMKHVHLYSWKEWYVPLSLTYDDTRPLIGQLPGCPISYARVKLVYPGNPLTTQWRHQGIPKCEINNTHRTVTFLIFSASINIPRSHIKVIISINM